MPVVSVKNISVEYTVHDYKFTTFKEYIFQKLRGHGQGRQFAALQDVSVTIEPGESVALLGHNGSGKSTLLKVIAGIIPPSSGELSTRGRIAPMIELGTGFDPELSGRENIMLSCTVMGLTRAEVKTIEGEVIAFSELGEFIDLPLKNYSSGMYARLGFACATAIKPEILIVDEILSVGDSNFSRKCLERIHRLRDGGTTFILVSHDISTVSHFCDRGIVLERGHMRYDGPVHEAIDQQNRIMDTRYLESLPEAQRAEILRHRAIERNRAESSSQTRPIISCRHWVTKVYEDESSGTPVRTLKTDEPFIVQVELSVSAAERIQKSLSLGIGLNTPTGQRVGGINLSEQGVSLGIDEFKDGARKHVSFHFLHGVTPLGAGLYHLIVGVMDSDGARELLPPEPLELTFEDPGGHPNFDGDIMAFARLNIVCRKDFDCGTP